MTTSSAFTSMRRSELSTVRFTLAKPMAPRLWVPPKITSSILPAPRSWRLLVSPSTQRMASEMLLLPEPFGPTTAVMPRSMGILMRSGKLLKPCISSSFNTINPPWDHLDANAVASLRQEKAAQQRFGLRCFLVPGKNGAAQGVPRATPARFSPPGPSGAGPPWRRPVRRPFCCDPRPGRSGWSSGTRPWRTACRGPGRPRPPAHSAAAPPGSAG